MRELYRYTNTIIAYELVPRRKYKYIKKILSVYNIKHQKEKHYVIIMNNDVVFEYYFDDEQKDLKKAVQIANSIYTNKTDINTSLIPTIYMLKNNSLYRYLKHNGIIYM